VISGWLALLVQRKLWQKIVIILSALPIALLCNTIRLAVTSIAFTYISGEKWAVIFHDYGGYAMMPLALVIIMGELWIMDNIFVDSKKEKTDKKDIVIKKVSE
jgi:exosortase/archaeosortase family protein